MLRISPVGTPVLQLWVLALVLITDWLVAAEPAAPAAATPPGAAVVANVTSPVPVPDDPLGRGTPRSCVARFLVAARDSDFALAAKYLNLSGLATNVPVSEGPRLARQLWFLLERQVQIDISTLSADALGDRNDGLPPNQERLVLIEWSGGFWGASLERVREPDGLEVWKVSARTVERIPKLYERFRLPLVDRLFSEATVDSCLRTHVFGLSILTWLNLAVLLCAWTVALFASLRLARWSIGRMPAGVAKRLLSTIYVPVVVLIVSGIIRNLIPAHALSVEIATFFRAQTMLIVVAVWIFFRTVDFAAEQTRTRMMARDGDNGFHLIGLLRRIAKVTLVVIGFILWLDNLGFKVTTIVASLGIVGIAVGLASQKFIEDLIGAMTLHATGVVKRNEAIRFGDQRGLVEDIGLRMITIRSRDRTLITMPNATFAAMQIENFGRRDKVLFQPRLGLRYETTPDQLRYVLIELRKMLLAHPKVIEKEARVQFAGFGACSLDVDIFCFISETDQAKYLAAAEDLNLRIMDIVAQAGTGFAFPSQTIYFERGSKANESLTRQAEAQVRRLREHGQLSDYEFNDEHRDDSSMTLDPPKFGPTDGPPQNL